MISSPFQSAIKWWQSYCATLFKMSIIILVYYCSSAAASTGDRLAYYHECRSFCFQSNCSKAVKLAEFKSNQPAILQFLGWTCSEECRHSCQFDTIKYLHSLGVEPNKIPQFHGKWTFTRILGAQEPASCFFSLLNLIATLIGFKLMYFNRIKRSLSGHNLNNGIHGNGLKENGICDSPRSDLKSTALELWYKEPFFLMTTISAVLGTNAWIWSTIFHYHDSSWTEKLDYFSATSLVLYNLYYILIRVVELNYWPWLHRGMSSGNRFTSHRTVIGIIFVSFFSYHVHYLNFIRFDYGYNMKVNIVAGILTSILWLFWSSKRIKDQNCTMISTSRIQFDDVNKIKSDDDVNGSKIGLNSTATDLNHIKLGIFCIIALNVSLLLEVTDFAPVWNYTIDSHALWHLATFPIPILWFRFLADEAICMTTSYSGRNLILNNSSVSSYSSSSSATSTLSSPEKMISSCRSRKSSDPCCFPGDVDVNTAKQRYNHGTRTSIDCTMMVQEDNDQEYENMKDSSFPSFSPSLSSSLTTSTTLTTISDFTPSSSPSPSVDSPSINWMTTVSGLKSGMESRLKCTSDKIESVNSNNNQSVGSSAN